MTEQTKQAIQKAAIEDTMQSKDYPISTQDAFVHGAEKLLKIVWHDTATEEPEEEKDLLLMFGLKDGRKSFSIGLYSEHSQKVWVSENRSFHWMKLSHYSKWAYIEDFLPVHKS